MDNYKRYLFDDKAAEQDRGVYSFQASQQDEVIIDNNFDDDYKRDFLQNQLKGIKDKLIMMGFPSIGDLYSNSNQEVEVSIKALFAIIQQRKQDIEFKNSIHDRISKLENEKLQLAQSFERSQNSKKQLETDNSNLQAKLKSSDKVNKEQINKLIAEKEELAKQQQKLQSRQTQFEHEIKQKDLELQKLKDLIRKQQSNKTFKNGLEITSQIEANGPTVFAANAEYEFSQLVMKRWEEINNKLQKENEQLRENLIKIHNELNEILQVRKEVYVKRRKIDFNDENIPQELDCNQMHQMKTELYKCPLEGSGKQAIQMLQENLQTFKELMKKFDTQYELQLNEEEIEIEGEGSKIKACKNLTELFKNYNFIFDAQDKMINQIINKSQSLKKIDELNFNLNRFNRVLDDKQIDEVKRYLADQKKYLDESKSEMDMIKKQFQLQLKKREEEKQIIQTKRQMLEETNEKFKENIRMLENASKQAIQQLNSDINK